MYRCRFLHGKAELRLDVETFQLNLGNAAQLSPQSLDYTNAAAGAEKNLGIADRHFIHRATLTLSLHLLKQMVEYRIQERLIIDGDCPIIAHPVADRRQPGPSKQALATCFCRVCAYAYLVFLHMCSLSWQSFLNNPQQTVKPTLFIEALHLTMTTG